MWIRISLPVPMPCAIFSFLLAGNAAFFSLGGRGREMQSLSWHSIQMKITIIIRQSYMLVAMATSSGPVLSDSFLFPSFVHVMTLTSFSHATCHNIA
jgi:hypothetical protein